MKLSDLLHERETYAMSPFGLLTMGLELRKHLK